MFYKSENDTKGTFLLVHEGVLLEGREFIIVFDSDVIRKWEVRHAMILLAIQILKHGGLPLIVTLPDLYDGSKCGLDSYLVHYGKKAFDKLLQNAQIPNPVDLIEAIRGARLKMWELNQLITRVVVEDLNRKGYFLHTPSHRHYFFHKHKQEVWEIGSCELSVYLDQTYRLNQTEAETKYVCAHFHTKADYGKCCEVYELAHFDSDTHILYVSDHAGGVYRLNGEQIEYVPNGTDGVLFLKRHDSERYKYLDIPFDTPSLLPMIVLDRVNFISDNHCNLTPDQQRNLLMIWFFGLFFPELQPTKVITLLTGEKGSGKTFTFKALGEILFGSSFTVTGLPSKEDDFTAAISNRHLVCYDNVDTHIPWLPHQLATTATGKLIQKRKLFTTNTLAWYKPCCFLALTSRTPQSRR